tara:strand:- start:657 stop:1022 length:366 start_codon:yes stop_codon:yes gene_type:complete
MDFDLTVIEWTERYGSVYDMSFMVFGLVDEAILGVLGMGIKQHLEMADLDSEMLIYSKDIDEDEARMMGTYQGTNVHVILPIKESIVNMVLRLVEVLTLDCFRYMRLKSEFIGTMESESLV